MDNLHTLLLTGLPRAGTTLSCNILNSHANVIALHEPLTPTEFDPAEGKLAAVKRIAQFAINTRIQALSEGNVLSQQQGGLIPENPVAGRGSESTLRQPQTTLGLIDVGSRIQAQDFTLIIKQNALFTALMPELQQAFPVYAIVRNPLAVLASWNSVDLPINRGHIPAGEMFDPALKQLLASISDTVGRQLHILEWFCANFACHLPNHLLRYEEFVANPCAVGRGLGLPTPYSGDIQSRESRNQGYDLKLMEQLYQRLMGFGDAIWAFYTRDQVVELMESIREAA